VTGKRGFFFIFTPGLNMKKFLTFILAIVYFSAAVPAACSMDNCERDCDGLKHIKTEDHHQASSGVFKLNPLSPAAVTGGQYPTQCRKYKRNPARIDRLQCR